MEDVRQSIQFANFMNDLGWEVEKINSLYIYLRKFPLIGFFAKMPRIKPPFPFSQIDSFIKAGRIFKLKTSPFIDTSNHGYKRYQKEFLTHGYKIDNDPFNPTATIRFDLTLSEKKIFNNFTEAKRRGVRRAIKNGVMVKESSDLEAFINIRKSQYFPLGFLVVKEMKKLWKNFYPQNATLLLAYLTKQNITPSQIQATASICDRCQPVAGILLLFYDRVAYYWYASSIPKGKELFAPTLLVWEALKLSKKRDGKIFDFEGIYDERFPNAYKSWLGFSRFKQGFGGKIVKYLENFSKSSIYPK